MKKNSFQGFWATFEYLDDFCRSIKALKEAGMHDITAHSPCPRHEIAMYCTKPGSRVPFFTLIFGLLGTTTAFVLATWMSLDWILPVSNKPIISIPPFTVIMFELTILFGAYGTVFGILTMIMRDTKKKAFPKEEKYTRYDRFSVDRFGLVVRCSEDRFNAVENILKTLPVFAISPVRSWMTDMWNQQSLKPQEAGSMMSFPLDSVTTEGVLVTTDGYQNPYALSGAFLAYRNDQAKAPKNPTDKSPESVQNGEYLYNVYCTSCHGEDGMAATLVGQLRGAPPIAAILSSDPTLAEGYLFSKIQYGNMDPAGMPPLGYATTEKERWDIVNYITQKWPAPKQ
ncbi:hypothetical protein CHS0354_018455 [Potamilus streckersoni]|uniref:Cytochrome c domain-containing protein n=1 Tax=Potamilus streckersoni TaxID=2493646 RepID=A0AAE0TAN5_9BIVA|nr:hypothetical protein CHS0354_018455 [Potamilus streckersoni]